MSTKVIKEGNVTTTIMDLTNGIGDKSAEVREAIQRRFKVIQSISRHNPKDKEGSDVDYANFHKYLYFSGKPLKSVTFVFVTAPASEGQKFHYIIFLLQSASKEV